VRSSTAASKSRSTAWIATTYRNLADLADLVRFVEPE